MTVSAADAPYGGGVVQEGTVELIVIGKDPVTQTFPYTVPSTATHIGYDGNATVDSQTSDLFRAYRDGSPAPYEGHLGGRSPEENTVTDTRSYVTPPFISANEYGNDILDAGEDGNNGGAVNGELDPGDRGVSLGIYSDSYVIIDHNIFAGTDSIGNPVRMALVSRDYTRIDGNAPKLTIVQSAVLAVTETWAPFGGHDDHEPNYGADLNGDAPPTSYVYDIDWDGTIEANNGMSRSEDRDETDAFHAWGIHNLGNLVVSTPPSSGHWAGHGHPRFYTYDTRLQTAEIPCYPTLPNYGIVPGSFTEVLNVP